MNILGNLDAFDGRRSSYTEMIGVKAVLETERVCLRNKVVGNRQIFTVTALPSDVLVGKRLYDAMKHAWLTGIASRSTQNPHPTGGVMSDWLRRSRMGMAEGRFIALNANTCLQQRREQRDMWGRSFYVTLELSHRHQALRRLPRRTHETPSTAPLGPVLEGLRYMLPVGG